MKIPSPATPPENHNTARFSGLRKNSPDIHVRAGPIEQASRRAGMRLLLLILLQAGPTVPARLFAWAFLIPLLLAACAPALPRQYAISASGQEITFFSPDFEILSRAPLDLPPGCQVWTHHPSPPGSDWLGLQLLCAGREAAWVYHLPDGKSRLFRDETVTDSRILAWADANFLYLHTNMLDAPRVMLADARAGRFHDTRLPDNLYHIDVISGHILYAFSEGIGFGSGLWRPDAPGPFLAAPDEILAFARFSPDGSHIAYIAMPDSVAAFPPGELWLLDVDSGTRRPLAPADAGRGFSPLWSPDGRWLAFADPQRNLRILHPESGRTYLCAGELLHNPAWTPDSKGVFFVIAPGDTIETWYCETSSGEISRLPSLDGAAWFGSWQP